VEVVTVVKEAPMYHPPPPGAISAMPVEWTVLTPAIMQEYLDDLEKGEAPMNVWYSLTSKGYENLSYNMAEIKRYLRQTKSIIQKLTRNRAAARTIRSHSSWRLWSL